MTSMDVRAESVDVGKSADDRHESLVVVFVGFATEQSVLHGADVGSELLSVVSSSGGVLDLDLGSSSRRHL